MRIRTSSPRSPTVLWLATWVLIAAAIGPIASIHPAMAQEETPRNPFAGITRLVPADATALIAISTDGESPQLDAASALLERGGLGGTFERVVQQFLRESGLSVSNLDPEQSSILGGAVALATWGSPSDPIEHGAAYIAAADPEAAFRSVVAQLLTEGGTEVAEADVPGGRLVTDADGDRSILLIDGVVVLASAEDAETVAGLVIGAGPPLATFEPFTTVMEAQAADTLARAYVNGPAIGRGLVELLGLSGLGWQEISLLSLGASLTLAYTSVGLTAADEGLHLRTAQLAAPLIGLTPPTDNLDGNPAERLSNQTELMIAGTDLGAHPLFVQFVSSLVIGVATDVGSFDPSTATAMEEALAKLEEAIGIDLQSEIIDQLRGDFVIAAAPKSFGRAADIDFVLASEVIDGETMRDTLNQLVGALRVVIAGQETDADLSEIALGNDIMYVLSLRESDGQDEIAFSFGLIDDELVMSLGRGYGRLLLPQSGATLATDERYLSARAALGMENGPIAYVDVRDLIEIIGQGALEPPPPWLDGFESLSALSYASDELAITDVVLTITDSSIDAAEASGPPISD